MPGHLINALLPPPQLKREKQSFSQSRAARLGVVIPAYNEEGTIGRTLASLLEAGVSPEEIHVVDDCSTDRTSLVASLHGVNILRNETNLGKARSIYRLISERNLIGEFDLIAFLDADTTVDSIYFTEMRVQAERHPEVVLFVGQVQSQKHNWITGSRAMDYTYMHDIYKSAQSKFSMITVGPGCASIYRTAALRQIDITNDTLAEDMDWTIQIYRKALGKIHYVPSAVVYTQDPATLLDYLSQIRRWYTGTWQVIRKHQIPFRWTRIDLEIGFLAAEALVYALLLVLLPFVLPYLLFFNSETVKRFALIDIFSFFGLAVYASIRRRRPDILRYFPLFYLIRFLNAYIFLESFCRTFKKEIDRRWVKVNRY